MSIMKGVGSGWREAGIARLAPVERPRWWEQWSSYRWTRAIAPVGKVEVEPDLVAQHDPVDDDPVRVAVGGHEHVSLDCAHPEADALVEAQVADVGGGGGDSDPVRRA